MSQLRSWLGRASVELGLQVEFDYKAILGDGRELLCLARIPYLGGPSGMLLFASSQAIGGHEKELLRIGFGYSVLDEPGQNESYDVDVFREMFVDWGWSGNEGLRPIWMH